jgi:hypothetical protein
MSHARQVIRESVVAILAGANIVPSGHVTQTRLAPQREGQLPQISVYTLDETIPDDAHLSAPRRLERVLTLAIEAWTKLAHDGAIDNQLDDLALGIETALHRDPSLGGDTVCNDSWLTSTQIAMKLDGNLPMGAIHLGYTVRYFTYAPETADVPLPAFQEFDTHYNLANVQDPDDQAEDIVTGLG